MPQTFKQQVRRHFGPLLQVLGYTSGLMQLGARLNSSHGTIILMYHSVADHPRTKWIDPRNHVPADIFARQMAFLARHKKVISLDALVATLARGDSPEDETVVITFDDGYLDNLDIAAPILDRLGLPATLFLPTGYIDRGETQWVDQSYTAFKFRTKPKLTWGLEQAANFDLDDPRQNRAGYQAVCEDLLRARADKRRDLLTDLYDQLQPTTRPPRLTMTWDDVRTLIANYQCFQIGEHTQEHTDLTSVSKQEAQEELADCAQRIENELGVQPRHFSFCYGRSSEITRKLLAETGIDAAFGACGNNPVVSSTTDLLNLPRVQAPASMRTFALAVSTANNGVWRRLGR